MEYNVANRILLMRILKIYMQALNSSEKEYNNCKNIYLTAYLQDVVVYSAILQNGR